MPLLRYSLTCAGPFIGSGLRLVCRPTALDSGLSRRERNRRPLSVLRPARVRRPADATGTANYVAVLGSLKPRSPELPGLAARQVGHFVASSISRPHPRRSGQAPWLSGPGCRAGSTPAALDAWDYMPDLAGVSRPPPPESFLAAQRMPMFLGTGRSAQPTLGFRCTPSAPS